MNDTVAPGLDMFPPHFVKVSSKGQVVIPAELRRKIGLEPGQKVAVYVDGEDVVVHPVPENVLESLTGRFAGHGSGTAGLVRDHQEEIERERRKSARRLRRSR